MVASDDVIAQLRAELSRQNGPARTGSLIRLGQALFERYSRAGPGQAAALPELDAAIEAMNEAYGYLEISDPLRGQVAGLLGWFLAARHGAHTGVDRDRDTGIHVLDEALRFPSLPPPLRATVQLLLGQLYLMRAAQGLQSLQLTMSAIQGGMGESSVSDLNRAVAHLRDVLAGPPISAEVNSAAEQMLTMAEAFQSLFSGMGGGIAGVDLGRIMQAFTHLQGLQEHFRSRFTTGVGAVVPPPAGLVKLPVADADELARLDPLDRPVAVFHGTESLAPAGSQEAPVTEQRPIASPTVGRAKPDDFRRALRDQLASIADKSDEHAPLWSLAAAALSGSEPPVDAVDEAVAFATLLTEQDPADPLTTAIDRFCLAVALRLRARLDGDAPADALAGARNLLGAAKSIPPAHPAAVTVLLALGAFIEPRLPFAGAFGDVAAGFADRADVIIASCDAAGGELATAHALRCLCRAATVLASGTVDGLSELDRVIATVPVEYPWHSQIQAAGQAAMLMRTTRTA